MLNHPRPSVSLATQEANIKSRLIPADIIDVNDREAAMHAMQEKTKRNAIFRHYSDHCVSRYGIRTLVTANDIIQKQIIPYLDQRMQECKEGAVDYIRYAITKRRISAYNPETLEGFCSSLYNLNTCFESLCQLNISIEKNQIYHPLVVFANQWLAASDNNMTFSPERQQEIHSTPSRRDEYITASKSAFISAFADDMCREYNNENDPLNVNDNTACGPGFIGKLFLSLNRYNHAVIMPLPNNTISFEPLKREIRNFIVEQLATLAGYNEPAKEQIKTGMFTYLSNCVIMQVKANEMKLDSEEALPYIQYKSILEDIQENGATLLTYLATNNPQWSSSLVIFEKEIIALFTLECEHLKMAREDANPDPVMIQRLFRDYFHSVAVKNLQRAAKEITTPAKVEFIQTIHQTCLELDTLYFVLENENQRINLDQQYADLPDVQNKLFSHQDKYSYLKHKIDNLDPRFEATYASYLLLIKNKEDILTNEAKDFGVQLNTTLNKSWKSELPETIQKQFSHCQTLLECIRTSLGLIENASLSLRLFSVNISAADWMSNFIRVATRKTPDGRYYNHAHEIHRLIDLMQKHIQQNSWSIDRLLDEINYNLIQIRDPRDEWNARNLLTPIFAERWGIPMQRDWVRQYPYATCLSQLTTLLDQNRVEFLLSAPSILLSENMNKNVWLEQLDNVKSILIENFRALKTPEQQTESIRLSIILLLCTHLKLKTISYTNVNELQKICGYFLGNPMPSNLKMAFFPNKLELNEQIQGLLALIACIIKTLSPVRAYFDAGMIQIMSNDAASEFLQMVNNPRLALCRISLSSPNLLVKQFYFNGTITSQLIGVKSYKFDSTGNDIVQTENIAMQNPKFSRCCVGNYSISFFDDIVYLRKCMNNVDWYSTRPTLAPLEWKEEKESTFLAESGKKTSSETIKPQASIQQIQMTLGYMYSQNFFSNAQQSSHYTTDPQLENVHYDSDEDEPGRSSSFPSSMNKQ